MKKQLTLLLIIASIAIGAIILFSFRKDEFSYSPRIPIIRKYYTVPYSHRHFLKCRYEVTLKIYGANIVDLINDEMRMLQSDEMGYASIKSLAEYRQQTPYQTVYQEALRNLEMRGILSKSDVDLCTSADVKETIEEVEIMPEDDTGSDDPTIA